jgi:hypothetical protein
MTNQPSWRLLQNLGDADPINFGGYFIFEDTTGVYEPEAEWLEAPDTDDGTWYVYRFALDRLKMVEDDRTIYLVPDAYRDGWPHPVHQYDEWFHDDLAKVAESNGQTLAELRQAFCSDNPLDRAWAYRALGEYHGFENLDSYPLRLTRAEAEERYADAAHVDAAHEGA